MPTHSQIRHAAQEADSLLQRFNVDQEAPIDVFNIVARLGLWLVFNRLDNLLGAVVPRGDGGIILTTQRAPAVQRYTAAHEVGHWILDYGELSLDTEADIYHPSADREFLAQIFAGQLLMPPPLIYATCTRHGIRNEQTATPEAVYLVARDIGSSYEAAARQLANLEIITGIRRNELLRIQPATIKMKLCLGHRPTGPVDVWPIRFDPAGATVTVTEGDEVVVLLPENRTTGYRWLTENDLERRSRRTHSRSPDVTDAYTVPAQQESVWSPAQRRRTSPGAVERALARVPGDASARRVLPQAEATLSESNPAEMSRTLALVDDQYQVSRGPVSASQRRSTRRAIARSGRVTPGDSTGTGAPTNTSINTGVSIAGTGTRLLALRSVNDGQDVLQLIYSSAYDPTAPPTETYRLEVQVKPSPAVQHRREYLDINLEEDEQDEGDRG